MSFLQLKKPIVFFDLETTGINFSTDKIVEIACIKLNPNKSEDRYIKRINPEMPIPAEASAIHGIYDVDIKDAPVFKMIAHELYDWMRGCDLGGYNAQRFDLPLLAEEFLRVGITVDFEKRKMIDVQHIFFKMEQRTLGAAYQFYCNKLIENAHSAEADIEATVAVLEGQIKKYENLSNDVDHLYNFINETGNETVDFARTMVLKNGKAIFNIGKYKGQVVADVFAKDPSYYDWMMKADFSLHTKQKISELLNELKLQRLKGN